MSFLVVSFLLPYGGNWNNLWLIVYQGGHHAAGVFGKKDTLLSFVSLIFLCRDGCKD
jgi:hypothetical protein